LHNENKNVHTHSWHSKIKAHNASNTWVKSWKYKSLFDPFYHFK
jgi:hypothetical protein